MNRLDMRAAQRQTQAMSPRLQHAVRLLQMSSLEFAALVRDSLGSNPFLEADEPDGSDPGDVADADTTGLDASDAQGNRGDSFDESDGRDGLDFRDGAADFGGEGGSAESGDPGDPGDGGPNDRDLWQADTSLGVRRAEDGEMSALEMMAVDIPLNAHLHGQLNVLPLSARDRALARTVVESLDDDGYLRTPLSELLAVAALNPAAQLAEMQVALTRVQALEPAGVAARSVGECLLLQLPDVDCAVTRELARRILTDHLNLLASRDVAGLSRHLGESPARVEAVCDRIRRLDPRPGWRFGSSHVAYVVPDVVVSKVRGQWSVQLNPAVVPKVRLNQVYAQLFQRHRTAQNAEMGSHLQEARWTLRNVEQRFSTIVDVAEAIVKRQRSFLEYGAMAMKPLGLREIADEVGVHESTVSRVVNNKYMATPTGVYELKFFFSRAMVSANGSACSGTAIRGLVKEIIEAEKPEAPLSDAQITRQLAEQGLVVARRTVTKYRQLLKIDAVERRRRVAS